MLKIFKQKMAKYYWLILAAVVFSVPSVASADDVIDVVFDPAAGIHETNIAPGQITIFKFTVTSKSDKDQDLMFRLSRGASNNLDDRMIVQLRQASDGAYLNMPNGLASQILSTINDNTKEFTSLGHRLAETYEFIFTFDPLAGNEYQGRSSIFDLEVGVDAEDADGNGPGGGPAGGAGPLTGFFTAGAVGGVTTGPAGEILEGGEGAPGEVQGEEEVAGETECIPVPWYYFAIALAVYALIMLYNLFYKFKEREDIRWFWEALYTILGLAIWYFFDRCRTNTWDVYGTIIGGFVIYLFYLYLFKKKVSNSNIK